MTKREYLLNTLEDQLKELTWQEAKMTYFMILKQSFRLYNFIVRLRVDNAMLNRPFIYKGQNL